MLSSYESARHREIHLKKELLRAHAIDQNNTGRVPEQVIAILAKERHRDPGGFLSRILIGADLTGQDHRVMREINTSIIPAVTPIKKPEEPKRQVKHTPPWNPSVPHVSWARIAQGAPASPAREARESDSEDYVMIDPITLRVTDRGDGVLMKKTTWQKIQELNDNGTILINRTADKWGVVIEFYPLGGGRAINHVGNVDEKIAELIKILEEKRIPGISIKRETEPQKPATVRIHLDTLKQSESSNTKEGIEISTETLARIEALEKLGTLIATSQYGGGYRFRFSPRETGGPYSGGGVTLDEAMQKLWGHLQELRIISEASSDLDEIDITKILQNTARIMPPVFAITPENLKNLETLKGIGRCRIYDISLGWGIELIIPGDPEDYRWVTHKIDNDFIARIIDDLRKKGKIPSGNAALEQAETPTDTVNFDIDDLQECTGKGPGVVSIPRRTLEDIIKLNNRGRLLIEKKDYGNYSITYIIHGNSHNLSGKKIENIIDELKFILRGLES